MSDREKVIKTLTDALTAKENYPWARAEMSFDFIKMLLELLKEQEAVKIEVKKINDSGRCGRCPNCINELNEMDYPNYCGFCGQAVKWE